MEAVSAVVGGLVSTIGFLPLCLVPGAEVWCSR
jgi:hypothetical protein